MTMYEVCLLHAQSDRALRSGIANKLDEAKITMMEWLLLGVVAEGSQKGVTMSDIAQKLHVTLPQVTALVNKLLPLKLIRQKSASNDRRSRLVSLTSKGELVLQEVNDTLQEHQNNIFGTSNGDEFSAYIRVMQDIASQDT